MAAKHHINITPDLRQSFERCEFRGTDMYMPDPNVVKFDNWPAMKKVIDALGGKWNRGAKCVVFPSDARALVLPAVEAGQVLDKKKSFQFFPTPLAVVKHMLNIADAGTFGAHRRLRVLEPSAGHGAILDALTAAVPNVDVEAVEVQAECRKVLTDKGYPLVGTDFLKMPPEAKYDLIVMNPPFTGDQDITHVRHAYAFLKPGGRLVSVMAGGVTSNDHTAPREFRAFVVSVGGQFIDVADGAFKESGTGVRTVLVALDKPSKPKFRIKTGADFLVPTGRAKAK